MIGQLRSLAQKTVIPAFAVSMGCSAVSVFPAPPDEARGAVAETSPYFTRQVEQLTGKIGPNQGYVKGQDSPVIVRYKERVAFFFGDTVFQAPGLGMIPNSLAWTTDFDAADGIDLVYYNPGLALPPLPRGASPEVTVWITSAFTVGDDLYANYISIPVTWPTDPPLGGGLAVMRGGVPPFVRTSLTYPTGDPLIGVGGALVRGGFVYFYTGRSAGFDFNVFLTRVAITELENRSAYEFLTDSGWSASAATATRLMSNSNPPSVSFNAALGKWIAMNNAVLSENGLASQITMRTADEPEGPWSEPFVLYGETLTGDGKWGSVYNAYQHEAFDADGGRTFYTSATNSSVYNVFLYETRMDGGQTLMKVNRGEDDAFGRNGTSASRLRAGARNISLRGRGKTTAGLRVEGDSFYPSTVVTDCRLTIPLYRAVTRPTAMTLHVGVGVPNAASFEESVPTKLPTLPVVGAAVVNLDLAIGATELVIEGSDLCDALTNAAQTPEWKAGRTNALPLYLTRVDDGARSVRIGTFEGAQSATLEVCVGDCALAR